MRKLSDEYIVVDDDGKPLGQASCGHRIIEIQCIICSQKDLRRSGAKYCKECAKKVKYERRIL